MGKISAPQAKNQEPSKPPAQVMEIVLKEEHKAIYDYFVKVLEVKAKLKESKGITDYFILAYKKILLTNVNPEKIRPLSEENFCQFLFSVLKEVREKKLANEENFKNGKIKEVVEACLADIRSTEAKDSLIKLVGLPLGIKIDPKNISNSFMSGLKEKIPFLGDGKKEDDELPLSDQEMVTTFLRKSLFSIIALTTVILLGGLSGPVSVLGLFTIPHVIVIGFAVFGLAAAEYKAVKGLFSNNKKGTLYDPSSQDKDDTEKRAKLNKKIYKGIDDILKTPIESALETIADGSKKQPTLEQAPQVGNKGGEQLTMLDGKITIDQLVEEQGQQSSKT